MASLLRSSFAISKIPRFFASFSRHLVNSPSENENNTVNKLPTLQQSRFVFTQFQNERSLANSLQQIDIKVRRSGRITRREFDSLLEEMKMSPTVSSYHSRLMIRLCGSLLAEESPVERMKFVTEIWDILKLRVPIDISHYNSLLKVYLDNEHDFCPTEFLKELNSKGIEPNRVTYQNLITRYCQKGDINGATKILEYMNEKKLGINENVFNALILGHSEAGDLEGAKNILNTMQKSDLEPSAETYKTLLCAYAKRGDMESIKSLRDEYLAKEIELKTKDYLDVIHVLAVNGHYQHLPEILQLINKNIGYNQDAYNAILRLVNAKQIDAAYTLLKSMNRKYNEDGSAQESGNFFVSQLVKTNAPFDKIVEFCDKIESEELSDRSLHMATLMSLEMGNENLAYLLMQELLKRGHEIRQHFFWPLLLAKAKESSDDGIINVLLKMNEFEITPNGETIREYVIPSLKGKSMEVFSKLREGNVSVGSSACNLVVSLLQKGDIEEAAIIISGLNAIYYPDMIKRPLTQSLYATNDYKAYMTILRNVYESLKYREGLNQEGQKLDANDAAGILISDLRVNRTSFLRVIEPVLQLLVKEGLSLSPQVAEQLQTSLGADLTSSLSDLLATLSSGELTPEPLQHKTPSYTPYTQMSINQLEHLVQNLEKKNEPVLGLKRKLLTLYCRDKNLEKAEEVFASMQSSSDFVPSAGIYAQFLELYSHYNKLDKATECYQKLEGMQADVTLDDIKLISYVGLLIKNNKFDESINLLSGRKGAYDESKSSFAHSNAAWRLLNSLADEGKENELTVLFDVLVQNNFIPVNSVVLGPFIKIHLLKDDLDKAMEAFESCCTKYRATPFKKELTSRLIKLEDAEKLQKLIDLSTSIHGEVNSLHDLVFAFVECGQIKQARKILETPGLPARQKRISTACEYYQQEGKVLPLEGLKEATKDLSNIDRCDIYYRLLLCYIKNEDANKAMGLWTQMQEEDVSPTDEFLIKLGKFLQKSNLNVPFAIPHEPVEVVQPKTILRRPQQTVTEKAPRRRIQASSIEEALHEDKFNEATNTALEILNKSGTIPVRIFRFLLSRLASAGHVEDFKTIGSKIGLEEKKLLSFDNKICHAYLTSGRIDEYLDILEKEIVNAKDNEVAAIADRFPRGGILGIFERSPEHIEKCERLAEKYAQRGVLAPMNALWMHYFSEKQKDKASEIWTKYLHGSQRVMFQAVLQKARQTTDEVLATDLIAHLHEVNVTPGALGNSYSCLLDILISKNNSSQAIQTFEEAVQHVQLENLNRTAILRVKAAYESESKPFNYIVPPKNNNTQSTVSLEDEEKVQNRS